MTEFKSYASLGDEADKYTTELQGWLDTFSEGKKARPAHEVESKRRRLEWTTKISELCRRAAAKQES